MEVSQMSLFDSGIRPAIDNWLLTKSKEERDYGEYFSASSAGYCQRRVLFERLGVPHIKKEDDARKQRVFTAGHLFHNWIQQITKEAGLSIAQELELQDEDLMIRGHIDDLVLVSYGVEVPDGVKGEYELVGPTKPIRKQSLILYDYKTRNSKNFSYAQKPSHYHRMQVGTYMYMLRTAFIPYYDKKTFGELTEARVLNLEKDTLRMKEVQYLWDTELESDVLNYWSSLNKHWKAKTLPKCTCDKHDGGFMAKEKWNPYFYKGEPCSIELYKKFKEGKK